MTLKIMNPNEKFTEYKDAEDFLWHCQNTVDINRKEKIALVIYQANLIYNMWDFECRNYPLTYEKLYDWLQLMKRQGRNEKEYIRHSTLLSYLEKLPNSMYTAIQSQKNSAPIHETMDDKGVTSEYATYYTLFRRGR